MTGADGAFRIVLHTAPYAPGRYTLAARYSFVGAYAVSTQILADGLQFDVS